MVIVDTSEIGVIYSKRAITKYADKKKDCTAKMQFTINHYRITL